MSLVLAYDIPNDKRRERLRKTLLRFGNPVQYSVFECDLSPRQLVRMRKAVLAVISLPEDNVRYYTLCRGCVQVAEVFGGKPVTQRRTLYVV
jgi:CRISPR-associated protein Cas2